MNLSAPLITALALSAPPPPLLPTLTQAVQEAGTQTPPPPKPTPMEGEIRGNRQDLADFLRKHRRPLKLRFFDRWGDPDLPIHSFVSLLDRPPFRETNGSPSCALHFTLFPF